jgi:mannose-1-phosphate guanylyltransferase
LRALILAAGFGTRLGSLTQEIPKSLVEVGGIPIIDRSISKLMEIGITEIMINTHYKSELIEEHLKFKYPSLNLILKFEPELLGTGGTLKEHIDWLSEDDFIVMHGDNFFIDSLVNLKENHEKAQDNRLITMAVFVTSSPKECGVIVLDKDGFVSEFEEKVNRPSSNIANAAIYIFKAESNLVIRGLTETENDISLDLIPYFLNQIKTVRLEGIFLDIGTIENLDYANKLIEDSN